MSYWFHRNPLKATATLTFELRGVSTDDKTRKIFSDLRQARNKLLEFLTDPKHERVTMEAYEKDYMCLMLGMVETEPFNEEGSENKLRRAIRYRWSNSMLGSVAIDQWDSVYEVASMLINLALWYTKHAAKIADKENPDMEEAKEVHTCLRIAAGMFSFVKEELIGKLSDNTKNGTDTDSRVLDAYINQCKAEAQEVTLARAVELKHAASLISALAFDSAKLFQDADDALQSLDEKIFGKWRKYFQLKNKFYLSYAHCYYGEVNLNEDKGGEAVRSLREAKTIYDEAGKKCLEYAETKGLGTFARPARHPFYLKFHALLERTSQKAERENGMIYHNKVPNDAPLLELKATHGLVEPKTYEKPALSPFWTKEVYDKMNAKMAPKPEEGKKKDKKDEDLAPVVEKETPMSEKEPSNCVIS